MRLTAKTYALTLIGIALLLGLLGLGAFVNRSCVFGSIAKLGSGHWAYAATPAGFFLGCLMAAHVVSRPRERIMCKTSPSREPRA